ECGRRVDHPVDHPPAQQGMEVLRRLGAHTRPEAAGHDHGCEFLRHGLKDGWGARIRTWDRGTKTRCLTTWLRPTALVVFPKDAVSAAARAKPARPAGRRRKRRLSTWLRPTALVVAPKDAVSTAARARPARPAGRRRKRRLSTWLRPTALVVFPKDAVSTAARAKPARPAGRRRKRRLSTWLCPTDASPESLAPTYK